MNELVERLFKVRDAGSTVTREALGGLTTFLTMAYIIVVNPVFLGKAGIPHDGAVLATVLASAFATFLMAFLANLPVALAPGMGLNAFFAYTICIGHGVDWRTGLGLLALVAIVFLALTIGRVRAMIIAAVPKALRFAAAAGIGLFITTIGLQHAGVVVDHPATLVGFGDMRSDHTLIALSGVALTVALTAWKVRTAIFWGLIGTAAIGFLTGVVTPPTEWISAPSGSLPGLEMDLAGALDPELLPLGVALLFFAIFDAMGTLFGVGSVAGLVDEKGNFPRLGRALTVDAAGALAGAGLGTSSVTCFVESAAGVSVGARTGLANVVTGGCFLLALFFMPLVTAVGAGVSVEVAGAATVTYYPVTAPALIMVGVLMARSVVRIDWSDMTEAVPAFLTLAVMPATFNISHGLAAGFISYAGMKLVSGRWREVHWLVYAIAALFLWRYAVVAGH